MSKKGFTLAEMLGVITILAILGLLIFPAVDKSIKSLASIILESHMKDCMVKSINEGKTEVIDEIIDLFKRFN